MDKLLALKMFVETVDAKGFSAAARRLQLATSSVTRALDGLEASLGAVLLNRSTRQVTVTEAGAAYYRQARDILEAVEEADAMIADRGDASHPPVGQLRVSIPVAFGRRCIAPYLGAWLAAHPQLELEVTLTDDIVDLLTARIDVSVRLGGAAAYDNVIAREIGRFRRRVVATPAYLARHGTPSAPMDLVEHRCLRFSYGTRDQVWTFRRDDASETVPITGHFRSNNTEVLLEVLRADGGIALLPDWLVDDDIASGRVTALFGDWDIHPDQSMSVVSALYLPNQRGSRRVAAFLAFLQDLPTLRPALRHPQR